MGNLAEAGKGTDLEPSPSLKIENRKLKILVPVVLEHLFLTWKEFSSPAEKRIKTIQNVTSLSALPSRAWSCRKTEVLSFPKPAPPAGPAGLYMTSWNSPSTDQKYLTPIPVCEPRESRPGLQQQVKAQQEESETN